MGGSGSPATSCSGRRAELPGPGRHRTAATACRLGRAGDLVVAVSCSGSTEETLSGLEEAVRRGCRLLVVARSGSRSTTWAARTGGLRAGDAGPPAAGQPVVAVHTAGGGRARARPAAGGSRGGRGGSHGARAGRCELPAGRPGAGQPGQAPRGGTCRAAARVWGTSPLAGAVAYRFACQLNENAKLPAVWGRAARRPTTTRSSPSTARSPGGGGAARDDFFRDRGGRRGAGVAHVAGAAARPRRAPAGARRADVSAELARERDVPVLQLQADGARRWRGSRRWSGLTDYASTYLALRQGHRPDARRRHHRAEAAHPRASAARGLRPGAA
jgi:glucose/mannose-6-phosphate isomerase